MWFKFSDAEADELRAVAEHQLVVSASECDSGCDPSLAENRALLIVWARIVVELHQPSPTMPPERILHGREDALRDPPSNYGLEPFMRPLAEREGLDFDKEFGPVDPRAFTPRSADRMAPDSVCSCGQQNIEIRGHAINCPVAAANPTELEFDELTRELLPARGLRDPADPGGF
jgi:hypothetical protein